MRSVVRVKLPDAALVVLSPKSSEYQKPEPSMRGVTFALLVTVAEEVCAFWRCHDDRDKCFRLKGMSKWTNGNTLPVWNRE